MFTGKENYSVSKQQSSPESSTVMAFLEFVLCYDLNKLAIYLSSEVSLQTGDIECFVGVASQYTLEYQNKNGKVSTQLQNKWKYEKQDNFKLNVPATAVVFSAQFVILHSSPWNNGCASQILHKYPSFQHL